MTPASTGCTVFLSEGQLWWWVGYWGATRWKMASSCPLVPREWNLWPLLFRRPLQKCKQSSLLWPRLLSDLYPQPVCVQATGTPAPQFSCVLFLAGSSDSKHQIFKDWQVVDPLPFPGGEPCRSEPGTVLSQKVVIRPCRCQESMVKYSEKL